MTYNLAHRVSLPTAELAKIFIGLRPALPKTFQFSWNSLRDPAKSYQFPQHHFQPYHKGEPQSRTAAAAALSHTPQSRCPGPHPPILAPTPTDEPFAHMSTSCSIVNRRCRTSSLDRSLSYVGAGWGWIGGKILSLSVLWLFIANSCSPIANYRRKKRRLGRRCFCCCHPTTGATPTDPLPISSFASSPSSPSPSWFESMSQV